MSELAGELPKGQICQAQESLSESDRNSLAEKSSVREYRFLKIKYLTNHISTLPRSWQKSGRFWINLACQKCVNTWLQGMHPFPWELLGPGLKGFFEPSFRLKTLCQTTAFLSNFCPQEDYGPWLLLPKPSGSAICPFALFAAFEVLSWGCAVLCHAVLPLKCYRKILFACKGTSWWAPNWFGTGSAAKTLLSLLCCKEPVRSQCSDNTPWSVRDTEVIHSLMSLDKTTQMWHFIWYLTCHCCLKYA